MSCGLTMISYSCWFIQVCMFFESLSECSLGFTYVCVAAVDVTHDVIDGSTLVYFRCFVFRELVPPTSSAKRSPNTNNNPRRSMLGLLYVAGISEQLGPIYKSYNIHMYHKPANTLHSMVVHPKDITPKEHQCGTIYNISCDIDSSHTYIGETKRILSQRFKEHINLDKLTGV